MIGLSRHERDVWIALSSGFVSISWYSSSDWEDSIAGVVLSAGSIVEVDGNDVKAFIWSVWSWIALSWFSCPSLIIFVWSCWFLVIGA